MKKKIIVRTGFVPIGRPGPANPFRKWYYGVRSRCTPPTRSCALKTHSPPLMLLFIYYFFFHDGDVFYTLLLDSNNFFCFC